MRLDKFICKSTEYSLLEASGLIEERRVRVNGLVVTKASSQAHINNIVTLDNEPLTPRPFRYFLLNKPADTVCSNVDEVFPSVLNLLNAERLSELHMVGRLDADTTGLLLVTDDGHWSFNLTSPEKKCEKVYKVMLSRPISPDVAKLFREGILLQGESTPTLPAKLKIIDPYNALLTLTEGRFHQVKRMFFATGNRVKALHRQRIGNLELDVDIGHWRSLTLEEVGDLSL